MRVKPPPTHQVKPEHEKYDKETNYIKVKTWRNPGLPTKKTNEKKMVIFQNSLPE